jgi:hypothetical protein
VFLIFQDPQQGEALGQLSSASQTCALEKVVGTLCPCAGAAGPSHRLEKGVCLKLFSLRPGVWKLESGVFQEGPFQPHSASGAPGVSGPSLSLIFTGILPGLSVTLSSTRTQFDWISIHPVWPYIFSCSVPNEVAVPGAGAQVMYLVGDRLTGWQRWKRPLELGLHPADPKGVICRCAFPEGS